MTLQEIKQQVEKLCEDTKIIMAALANMIEDTEKGGPGSGRKPGGGSGEAARGGEGRRADFAKVGDKAQKNK